MHESCILLQHITTKGTSANSWHSSPSCTSIQQCTQNPWWEINGKIKDGVQGYSNTGKKGSKGEFCYDHAGWWSESGGLRSRWNQRNQCNKALILRQIVIVTVMLMLHQRRKPVHNILSSCKQNMLAVIIFKNTVWFGQMEIITTSQRQISVFVVYSWSVVLYFSENSTQTYFLYTCRRSSSQSEISNHMNWRLTMCAWVHSLVLLWNEAHDDHDIPNSDPFIPKEVLTLYPQVDEWLTELDLGECSLDKEHWAQYTVPLNNNGYMHII